jgi:predicted phosphohydrolase
MIVVGSMTTLLHCSDLHTEQHRDGGKSVIDGLYNKDVDIAVVAGDLSITANNLLQNNIKMLCDKFQNVVYVLGNHEYYNSSLARVDEILGNLESEISNLTWLNDSRAIVEGVSFIGGTLWFPRNQTTMSNEYLLHDFNCILDSAQIYNRHEITANFLKQNMQENDIVVTHHLPTQKSIAPKYKGDVRNCFFACDLDNVIEDKKPKVWLHGHTHTACDYLYHSTRITCNPFGYIRENNPFSDSFTIEV